MKQFMWAIFHGDEKLPRSLDFRKADTRWSRKYKDCRVERVVVKLREEKYLDIYTHEFKIVKK